ncbi:MAG: hypothetical protein IJO38_03830 [Akkermansia sp.]|nr:hypothetical protein [Akkermansia sp.]MBQ9829448.1 hypothetical protein [Akkermansia sp.]
MNKALLTLCFAAGAVLLGSCQQKQYKAYFLTESSNPEAGAAFNVRYNGRMYNRMPIMSLKHFEKFKSFMADDGSYGMVLYTPKEYRLRLYTETQQNLGKHILPVIDGLAFDPLLIDQGINDGQLIIWGGLNGYDLRRISETLEAVDPEIEEKRYLDDDPRPKPELPKEAAPTKDEHGRIIPELYSSSIRNKKQ